MLRTNQTAGRAVAMSKLDSDETWRALSDPMRRAILDLLHDWGNQGAIHLALQILAGLGFAAFGL